MAEVLVLVDHVDGAVRKTTGELLTLARRLGEPAAVFVGAGYDDAAATLAEYGAPGGVPGGRRRRRPTSRRRSRRRWPGSCRTPTGAGGDPAGQLPGRQGVAARLAIRLGSGIITDAVDVQAGDRAR